MLSTLPQVNDRNKVPRTNSFAWIAANLESLQDTLPKNPVLPGEPLNNKLSKVNETIHKIYLAISQHKTNYGFSEEEKFELTPIISRFEQYVSAFMIESLGTSWLDYTRKDTDNMDTMNALGRLDNIPYLLKQYFLKDTLPGKDTTIASLDITLGTFERSVHEALNGKPATLH